MRLSLTVAVLTLGLVSNACSPNGKTSIDASIAGVEALFDDWQETSAPALSLWESSASRDETDFIRSKRVGAIRLRAADGRIRLPSRVALNLFDDKRVIVDIVSEASEPSGVRVWHGRSSEESLEGAGPSALVNSTFITSDDSDEISGYVETDRGIFRVITAPDGNWITETAHRPQEDTCRMTAANSPPEQLGPQFNLSVGGEVDGCGNTIIDVFVGFSTKAATRFANLKQEATMLVEQANTGLLNAGIKDVKLRVVGVGTTPNDQGVTTAALHQVETWLGSQANAVGADLIAMVAESTADSAGGWANVGGYISIVLSTLPSAWRHEVGHNAGGLHCREATSTGYGFGWNTGDPNLASIMCGNSTVIYSTPRVNNVNGKPWGVADKADMARMWRERAGAMSARKPHVVPFACPVTSSPAPVATNPVTCKAAENASCTAACPAGTKILSVLAVQYGSTSCGNAPTYPATGGATCALWPDCVGMQSCAITFNNASCRESCPNFAKTGMLVVNCSGNAKPTSTSTSTPTSTPTSTSTSTSGKATWTNQQLLAAGLTDGSLQPQLLGFSRFDGSTAILATMVSGRGANSFSIPLMTQAMLSADRKSLIASGGHLPLDSTAAGHASSPMLLDDGNGQVTALWLENSANGHCRLKSNAIAIASDGSATAGATSTVLDDTPGFCSNLAAKSATDGSIAALWVSDDTNGSQHLRFAMRPASKVWTSPVEIAAGPLRGERLTYSLDAKGTPRAMVAFLSGGADAQVAYLTFNGTWDQQARMVSTNKARVSHLSSVEIGDGFLFVWGERTSDSAGLALQSSVCSAAGSCSPASPIETDGNSLMPDLVSINSNSAMLTYVEGAIGAQRITVRVFDSAWGKPLVAAPTGTPVLSYPRLAVDARARACLAWGSLANGANTIFVSTLDQAAQVWQAPHPVGVDSELGTTLLNPSSITSVRGANDSVCALAWSLRDRRGKPQVVFGLGY